MSAVITSGQGLAAADSGDAAGSAQTASASTDAGGAGTDAPGVATDDGAAGSSSDGGSTGSATRQPVSTVSAQQNISAKKDDGPDGGVATANTALESLAGSTVTLSDADTTEDHATATSALDATSIAKPSTMRRAAQTKAPDHTFTPTPARSPKELMPLATLTGSESKTLKSEVSVSALPDDATPVATPAAASLAASTVTTTAAVTPVRPAAAARSTLAGIVTNLLNWMGLGPRKTIQPVPAWPVGPMVQSLWLMVREINDRFASGRPAANPTVASAPLLGPDGVAPDPLELSDLLAHPGVAANLNTDGSLDVLDGRFVDTTVASAVDAAELLNRLAPVLGAAAGFADPANITVQHIGHTSTTGSDVSETVYRVRDSLDGIPVLGSEAILITDAGGAVTGLFNNLRNLAGVDVTPDALIDQKAEAAAAAAPTYLTSATWVGSPLAQWVRLASSRFDPQLVVYAFDPNGSPRVAWQVTVTPARRVLAPSEPSTVYYVYANGADAGAVMSATTNAQGATTVSTSATDVLGHVRTINTVQVSRFFRQIATLQDLPRNITTYRTAFAFLTGTPYVPSGPIQKRRFGGWDTSGVSGQANAAEAYDYYQSVLGVTSYDGNGAPITVVVEWNTSKNSIGKYNNAYWDPATRQLVFGNGSNLEGAVDVVAHEYTHAIVTYALGQSGSVGLDHGEAGALNEAYADIMGSLIEGKTDSGRWLIGEDSDWSGGALRDLADPTSFGTEYGPDRDNYATRYTGTGDDGGEHVNSTIFSHAAYEMMTDAATTGISTETWSRVFYHSLFRLSSGATFLDGRAAVLDAAHELGFTVTQLGAISRAFDGVGIVASA
ncbi:M4 family peptidase [Mycobacterium hodleri]|uniref:M4 family peptidase n=1 Tax=Mycolicibacterium hodleri TaxID=49897 RepID=A0A502EJB9_9MYCO|nr:M4 family peptidase [Mycolicibacterium hodleri]